MDYQLIEKQIEEYVTGLFEQNQLPVLIFHNLDHTKMVVKRTLEIAAHYNVSDRELFILIAAAWFHDTGYLFAEPDKHEEMSCQVMKKFMKDSIEEETIIEEIHDCAMVTKFPTIPKNLLQEIICDADTYHFGTKEFKETNKKVLEELKVRNGKIDPVKFREDTIQMLKAHVFYTSYCKDLLNKGKEKNLKRLEKKEKISVVETSTLSDLQKDKSDLMGKGIQTMLRLTSANHLKLSEMADRKANILISVNAIIISVILSVLVHKLDEETYLIIPTMIFLIFAVVVIVISILATRPKISGGSFMMSEVKEKKTNLLFFGNFYKATYEEYNEAMSEMMLDTNYLYNSLIKDIYSLGVVLGRKYKLIRLAYNIFMIGIIVSVLAFGIAIYLADK
ncbi:MAG: Pycsar system effector family protein [Ginsengibacter sp.]